MEEIKAPNDYDKEKFSIFLAGSIETGKAEKWQDEIVQVLKDFDIQILNPRREDWDSSWEQSIDNTKFKEQVEWELKAQEDSDLIVMYFDENTKSPITLLELGLFVKQKPIIVCCPEQYWRRGNVGIVSKRYGAIFVSNKEAFIKTIKNKLINKGIRYDK